MYNLRNTLPLMPFSNIKCMSSSVNNSNFTLVYFKHASNANPGVGQ